MAEITPHTRTSPVGRTVVSRRMFLKGTGGIALAGALAPLLFEGQAFATLGTGTTPELRHGRRCTANRTYARDRKPVCSGTVEHDRFR
jgi:hypothetical protein